MIKPGKLKIISLILFCTAILFCSQTEQVTSATKVEGKLNINTATVQEFTLLPMIGPSKAAAVVTYREENGPFEAIEDLVKVKGIGRRTLQRLEPYLMLKGESNLNVVVVAKTGSKNAPATGEKNQEIKEEPEKEQ